MKSALRLLFCTVLVVSMLLAVFTGCSSDPVETEPELIDSSTLPLDNGDLYGMCFELYPSWLTSGYDYELVVDAMADMGVKNLRLWLHADYLMTDPVTFDEEKLEKYREYVDYVLSKGISVIGMNHHWFSGTSDNMATPMRDMSEGSAYRHFLLAYETTWYNLVSAFPEITLWEIGNEWNNDVFLRPLEYKTEGLTYTVTEKARITLDMLYYASRGIHRANPEAITMLGGLADIDCGRMFNAKGFLNKLYEEIETGEYPSTNPDHFFQTVAWHPYWGAEGDGVTDRWIQYNLDMYQIILDHEGHDKPVYFTELGYSDMGQPDRDEKGAKVLTDMYTVVKEKMPFVQTVNWFRMFNDANASSWGATSEMYNGLFYERGTENGFTLKKKGWAYYEIAGGTGDMSKYEGK